MEGGKNRMATDDFISSVGLLLPAVSRRACVLPGRGRLVSKDGVHSTGLVSLLFVCRFPCSTWEPTPGTLCVPKPQNSGTERPGGHSHGGPWERENKNLNSLLDSPTHLAKLTLPMTPMSTWACAGTAKKSKNIVNKTKCSVFMVRSSLFVSR